LEEWIGYWGGDDDYRPDLSRVAVDGGGEGAGFLLCDMDAAGGEGWVTKLGVRPRWRGRGLAAALLSRTLHDLRSEGLCYATLEVGADNPTARRVYERLGFRVAGRRTLYAKEG
jgi:ribosomal protein S18 acetylase RimI-like enzyme